MLNYVHKFSSLKTKRDFLTKYSYRDLLLDVELESNQYHTVADIYESTRYDFVNASKYYQLAGMDKESVICTLRVHRVSNLNNEKFLYSSASTFEMPSDMVIKFDASLELEIEYFSTASWTIQSLFDLLHRIHNIEEKGRKMLRLPLIVLRDIYYNYCESDTSMIPLSTLIDITKLWQELVIYIVKLFQINDKSFNNLTTSSTRNLQELRECMESFEFVIDAEKVNAICLSPKALIILGLDGDNIKQSQYGGVYIVPSSQFLQKASRYLQKEYIAASKKCSAYILENIEKSDLTTIDKWLSYVELYHINERKWDQESNNDKKNRDLNLKKSKSAIAQNLLSLLEMSEITDINEIALLRQNKDVISIAREYVTDCQWYRQPGK
jgi:hypothetical protein